MHVRQREKWLEFLLGAPPDPQEYADVDNPPPPLPAALADRLRIDLRPHISEKVVADQGEGSALV